MKFRMNDKPPAIELKVNQGGESIAIEHRYLTATERMSALELMSSGGMSAGMAYLWQFIEGWTGVEDENGSPIAFPVRTPEMGSQIHPTVDAILGRLPVSRQLELLVCQLAANGVNFKRFEGVLAELVDETTTAEVGRSADPLSSPSSPAPMKS